MQLDRTLIVVRERGVLDILDLSLLVLRRYARPVALTFLMGALPLAVLNHFLIGSIPDFEYRDETLAVYVWLMVVLVAFESQLAGVFTTAYLGKSVFLRSPKMSEVIRDVGRSTIPLIWTQLIMRGILPAWLLLYAFDYYESSGAEISFLVLLAMVVTGFRAFRPYLTEVVLLERNPLFAKKSQSMTIGRRSGRLHSPNSGEVFARWVTSAIVALLLSISLGWTMLWFPGVFTNHWMFGPYMLYFGIPAALWIVACFFTVARFLNYLDLRIRQEGWEVELRVRAEAARIRARLGDASHESTLHSRAKSAVGGAIVALLLLCGTAERALAQDHTVDPVQSAGEALASHRGMPWYDAQADGLRRVEVEPQNPDPDPSNPDWNATPATPRNWSFSWLQPLLEVLYWVFWVVTIVAIVLAIWFMVRAFLTSEAGVPVSGAANVDEAEALRDAYRIEQLPFQLDHTNRGDLLAESKRRYEAGDYRGAIVYLFSFQLLLLDKHHLIRLAKGKTNRQYLRETRGFQRVAELLERAMLPFEDVFFGDHPLDRARFEGCWNALPEFQQLVEKESPAS